MTAAGLARAMCVRHEAIGRTYFDKELAARAVEAHRRDYVAGAGRREEDKDDRPD